MPFFPFLARRGPPLSLLASCALALWTSAAGGETLSRISGATGSANWFAPIPAVDTSRGLRPAPGLIEKSLTSEYGVGVISTQVSNDDAGNAKVARLDTTWVTTSAANTLRLGDSINRAGTWGRSLRFGGLQYGTNLRNTPETITPAPAASLLGRGLVDHAYAAGFLRSNYGLVDDRYGPMFASAILRRGILENVTAEVRGSARDEVRNGGVALHIRMHSLGVLTAATAASESAAGIGKLAQTGFEYRGGGLGLSVGSQWTSYEYRQLGIGDDAVAPRHWSTARATYDLARYGALGIGYSAVAQYGQALTKIMQATYQVAVGQFNSLTLSCSRALAPTADTSLMVTFSFPIDALTRSIAAQTHPWNAMQLFDRKPGYRDSDLAMPANDGIQ